MHPGICHDLMPQVFCIVSQLFLVLALTNENLLHVTGHRIVNQFAHPLIPARHAPLMKWLIATLGATLGLELLGGANLLVQLIAIVQLCQAVEIDVVEVLKKSNDVAAEVQQMAVLLASLRR